ncbi:choice-of-anchor L domain-containing protein, partial [Aurantibacter sp.]|uniref:choice-of-anchor L domain-containing protein n=1 Tax=Aurantibacter sp. TaxID=2807103 RepID=UPI0035C79AAA
MKKKLLICFLVFNSFLMYSQDVSMQNGTFNQCTGVFTDSGSGGNYGNDENFTITICPDTSGTVMSLDFTSFSTQANADILTIYDGDSTASPVLGTYSGGPTSSPGLVIASPTNTSGCLTINFTSDASVNSVGWTADIQCAAPCQTITPSIDSTSPVAQASGIVEVPVGVNVDFFGSAIFSDSPANANYNWDFGTGADANTQNASFTYPTSGSFTVTYTVSDDNPLGCSESVQIEVLVLEAIITSNNAAFPESSFSIEELIDQVLVSGGCSGVSNFSSQVFGQPDDLVTKSYGYFTQGGALGFPFERGIILSTGNASLAGNTVRGVRNDVGNGQGGDVDLETALGQTGTNDATFVKFDFVPTGDNISFRYIMASEEYDGGTECNFADSFAFLLREVGTPAYQNLAVLPDGTPVSVLNINNAPGCLSNPAFFEGYTVGQTNYNGRTKVLTASANVVAGTTYEIKLVVADQGDSAWDSAIFLEAGSFNLGGDLGDDITIAAGNSTCLGNSLTLDTQADSTVPHIWYFNGVEIIGEVSSTIDVSNAGIYSVDVIFDVTCTANDEIVVEFVTPATVGVLDNLTECSQNATEEFDLSVNTPLALGTQSITEYSVSYHISQLDADNDANPIPNPTIFSGTDGQIIYVRVEDVSTQSCFVTDTFTLSLNGTTTEVVADLVLCDDNSSGDGFEFFNLESQTATVLGTQSAADYTVTYHLTQAGADANTGVLVSPYQNTSNPQRVFIRVENNVSQSCFSTTFFDLIVNDLPTIVAIPDYELCDNDIDGSNTNGFVEFDLTTLDATVINGQANTQVIYFEDFTDANNNINPILNPNTYTNTTANTQELFVRLTNMVTLCSQVTSFNIVVNPIPVLINATLVQCDEDGVPDGFTVYNLNEGNENVITTGVVGDYLFEHYLNLADAQAQANVLASSPFTNTVNPQTIIIRVQNNTSGCVNYAEITLDVTATDISGADLDECDDDYDGFVEFDLTEADAIILASLPPGLTVDYYESTIDAQLEQNQLPDNYTNTVPFLQTIFVRVENANDCFGISSIDLTVNPLPQNNLINDFTLCSDTPNAAVVDLSQFDSDILGTQNPLDFTIAYFENQSDANANSNALTNPFTTSSNSQNFFVRVTNNVTGCFITTINFTVNFNPNPLSVPPTSLEVCDDTVPDGFTIIDLNVKNTEITGGNTDYAVTYYLTLMDAENEINPLPI